MKGILLNVQEHQLGCRVGDDDGGGGWLAVKEPRHATKIKARNC